MTKQIPETFLREWLALHNSYEKFETLALVIKLVAVLVCLAGFIFNLSSLILAMLILVLWLQDAIWKTFQGRTEQRLLVLEKANSENDQTVSLNFYSHWEVSRPGIIVLVREYLSNAVRPTIAYPYIILLPICFL